MIAAYVLITVVVVLVLAAIILAPRFDRRQRSDRFQETYGPEYDRTVEIAGSEKKAHSELEEGRSTSRP